MKKVRGITLSLISLGSLFLIGPLSISAESVLDENELFAIPVDISIDPKTTNVDGTSSITRTFTLSFGGGIGKYNWTFNPENGNPTYYGTSSFTKETMRSQTYSLQQYEPKYTWYPRATVTIQRAKK
ncbi:hypothetical protein [Ornithinibacillus bavariensis]|uniref:hypothetical protein n=1 Tax=Ornithinibacillus bavariensis TaxID=545502 RepID=UPI000ED152B9|nr:hypothetical protein [Ornithinibacillus sp.]